MFILRLIEKNFGIILFFAALTAFLFPQYFLWGEDFIDECLMFALFLGCLKIDFSEIFHLRENFLKMLGFVFLNILILPIAFYFFSFFLGTELRIGLFLLLAASGAVVTPLLASFLRLKILWSTIFVVITSSMIPITLPLLTAGLFGFSIDISFIEMMLFLAKMVFIPAFFAIFFRRFTPELVKKILPFSGSIGSLNMAIFIGVIVAVNLGVLSENLFQVSTLPIFLCLFLLFIFRFFLGFLMPYANLQERWTNSLMFGNMNNGLIILLASEFFSAKVLLVVLFSEIPWILAQPIFQKLLSVFYKTKA